MNKRKYSAKEIAKWFINRANEDIANGGEYLTQLKLQKLMYYAKGFYYVFENEKLFNEKIYAQKFGPVVNVLVDDLKKYGKGPIAEEFKEQADIEDPVILNVLNFVYDNVGIYTARKLVEFTHNETPWCSAKKIGQNILEETISDFFRNEYLQKKDNNAFHISENDIYTLITKNNLIKYNEAFKNLAQ